MNKISNNKFCFLHSILEHHGLKLRVFHKLIHSAVSLSLYIQYNWILIQPIDSAVSLELLGPGISPVKTVPPGEDQRGFSRGAGETLMRFQLPTGQVGLVGWHVFLVVHRSSPKRTQTFLGPKNVWWWLLKYEYMELVIILLHKCFLFKVFGYGKKWYVEILLGKTNTQTSKPCSFLKTTLALRPLLGLAPHRLSHQGHLPEQSIRKPKMPVVIQA